MEVAIDIMRVIIAQRLKAKCRLRVFDTINLAACTLLNIFQGQESVALRLKE